MEKSGSNEVQLSDMTNHFLQKNVPNTWKKKCLAIFTENQLRSNSSFAEFFKCNTNSKSIICRKKNAIRLTVQTFPYCSN